MPMYDANMIDPTAPRPGAFGLTRESATDPVVGKLGNMAPTGALDIGLRTPGPKEENPSRLYRLAWWFEFRCGCAAEYVEGSPSRPRTTLPCGAHNRAGAWGKKEGEQCE